MTNQRQRIDALQIVGLIALAGALVFLGAISFTNQLSWREPTDGVRWELRDDQVTAAEVETAGAGADAGLHAGDTLMSIDGQPPIDPLVVEIMLFNRDVGERVEYMVHGAGADILVPVIVGGRRVETGYYYYLAFVGLAFLLVGIFALLRGSDSSSRRFFVLAIAFYLLFTLSATTRDADPWNNVISWLDQIARAVVPGLFVYFALTFPRPKREFEAARSPLTLAIFAPGVLLFAINLLSRFASRWMGLSAVGADRLFQIGARGELLYFALAIVLGVATFAHTLRSSTSPAERMRLKWLVGGLAVGFLPFLVIYLPMEMLGLEYVPLTNLSMIPLMLVPLSFAYAAVGFRLWDVEVILKQSITYAVAILVVLGVYFASQWSLARLLGPEDQLVQTASLLAMLLVAIGFAPLREKLSDLADRLYYHDSYRARRTLMDFGRELNSETDLSRVVDLLARRVRETLHVGRVAVLLRARERHPLRIVPPNGTLTEGRQLSSTFSQFVAGALSRREFLYVDDLGDLLDENPDDGEILEAEDLSYFLPLDVKGDIIGVLALGRKLSGDYLSTEDLKVLQPLAAHLALAIDNALLYREVQRRAGELERLKEYSENVVESIKAGVMVLDENGHVQSWNRSLARLYGIEPEQAMGLALEELFPASFNRVLSDARAKLHRGLEPVTSAYRIPLRTRAGKDCVVTFSMAPLVGEQGGEGTVIIVDDVTERAELESQLQQAEKLTSVGLLAAGVAHEVNTPLTGISSYVQMLQRRLPKSDPHLAILEKIEKQSFRASQIVNNLLNFSRQETGDFRHVHLNDVVHDTLALAEIQLNKRNIKITTKLGDVAPVTGDPIKLQQVLMNLLLNARDAMPTGGELRIETTQNNGDSMLRVSDTGTGIKESDLDKVYDPFFTTKGIGKGTGLGLSVSYGIIQEHRGTIAVESDPDTGTTFRITLPSTSADWHTTS